MSILQKKHFSMIVIVAALGYFVDIYDLILFSVVRKPSLEALGLSPDEITNVGLRLMSWQMIGMLLGGILWGVLGDKRGRISVLFGSIIIYSAANILNGLVTNVTQYEWLRLIAGFGLAGELGAGITLVSETMSKDKRGYGSTIVVGIGVTGAVLASYVGRHFDWNIAYFIGGGLGLMLLILRLGVYESGMFESMSKSTVHKGNLLFLFSSKEIFKKYLRCIAIGLPIWYVIGILIFLVPEFSVIMGIKGASAANAVMWCYIGHACGDSFCGLLSQWFKNRKIVLFVYMCLTSIAIPIYLFQSGISLDFLYFLCAMIGAASGFWVVFITVASEQFGTNIRATVTTTVPNFVRGSLALMTVVLNIFWKDMGIPLTFSALILGFIVMSISFTALFGLKETFGKDLHYVEE